MTGPRTAAFETSTTLGGVAIGEGNRLFGVERFDRPLAHGAELIPALDRLVRAAGWTPKDVARIAVDVGPGSFTGLRIGLAAAKTLALTLAIPLVGVASYDVLARGFDHGEPFAIVLDARRDLFHVRCYARGGLEARADGPAVTATAVALALPIGLPLAGDGAPALAHALARLGRIHPVRTETLLADPVRVLELTDVRGTHLDPRAAAPDYGMSGIKAPE